MREALSPGDAERLARDAEPEFDTIVAAGGDGTVAAVANGIAAAPRPLAILPLGTANVLAAEIGVPRGAAGRAAMIAEGPARQAWPGEIGGRLFLTSAGVGFDADVVAAVDPRLKRRGGRFAFVWAALGELWRFRPTSMTVIADGIAYRAGELIVTTGRLYAGGFAVAPQARLDEPVLHLALFEDRGRVGVLGRWAALLFGRSARAAGATIAVARKVEIAGPVGAPVQADGDIVAALPVTIEIAPRPIPLVRPNKM